MSPRPRLGHHAVLAQARLGPRARRRLHLRRPRRHPDGPDQERMVPGALRLHLLLRLQRRREESGLSRRGKVHARLHRGPSLRQARTRLLLAHGRRHAPAHAPLRVQRMLCGNRHERICQGHRIGRLRPEDPGAFQAREEVHGEPQDDAAQVRTRLQGPGPFAHHDSHQRRAPAQGCLRRPRARCADRRVRAPPARELRPPGVQGAPGDGGSPRRVHRRQVGS